MARLPEPPSFSFMAGSARYGDAAFATGLDDLPIAIRHASNDRVDLRFADGSQMMSSTIGDVARRVEHRIKNGSASYTDALNMWMPRWIAQRLQTDLTSGSLHLWVKIMPPEREPQICDTLFAHGPTRVEVHDLLPTKGPDQTS